MRYFVKDICDFMESWAPPKLAYPWDRIGLQTGEPAQSVRNVLVCLTVTMDVIRLARKTGTTMIISHHPLIWEPLHHLRLDDPHSRLCVELVSASIACFVAHTNLDVTQGGVNDVLAHILELNHCKPLLSLEHLKQLKLVTFLPEAYVDEVRNALAAAGAGVIGDYTHCSFQTEGMGTFVPGAHTNPFSGEKNRLNREPEIRLEMVTDSWHLGRVLEALQKSHPYEEPAFDFIPLANSVNEVGLGRYGHLKAPLRLDSFAQEVRVRLKLPYVQIHGNPAQKVETIAVLSGSGKKLIDEIPSFIDAVVSGDLGYHDIQTALSKGLAYIDAGHAGTELPIVKVIAQRLRSAFKGISVRVYLEPPSGRLT